LSEKERENALNEIRILASLSTQNIIQYRDSIMDTDSNILCVIMELATGGDLSKLVE
jgi:NIMA (never in mitosis gene a)-related kinase